MGERLLCKQEVIGSIPFTSTRLGARLNTADRIYASLVGEFELGPLGLGKREDRVCRAGLAGIGGRLALFSIFLSNAGVGRVFALFVIVNRLVG